jgi:hypothetical protein
VTKEDGLADGKLSPEGQELARFLGFFVDRYVYAGRPIPPEIHPLRFVNEMAEKAPGRALSGLKIAVGDCIEMSFLWSYTQVNEADEALRANGIVTLTEIRRRYSRRFKAIIKRGKIRNEQEYYLVKAASSDPMIPATEESALQSLLEDFEERSVPRQA